MRRSWLLCAATCLAGCGNVMSMATPDAAGGGDGTPNDGFHPCAPDSCLLADDFTGTALDAALWGASVGGGATVSVGNGQLVIKLPAAAEAFADVYSLVGFPAGVALEAVVTLNAGQFYDHKGIGFASGRISHQCDVGETDAAMFRGQDGDGYIESKAGSTYSCTRTLSMYPRSTSKLQITRMADQVVFHRDDTELPAMTTNVPGGLLPVRFSAYTYTTAPLQPVEIDVDYVFVKRQ